MIRLNIAKTFLTEYSESRKKNIKKALKDVLSKFSNQKLELHYGKQKLNFNNDDNLFLKNLKWYIENDLLIKRPFELHSIIDKLGNLSANNQKILEIIFDYDKFKDSEAWNFNINENNTLTRSTQKNVTGRNEYLNNLKLYCCPYCNRSYIFRAEIKVKQGKTQEPKIVNPDLDHYFPKSKYPYLALCIYNLIPCCTLCNSRIKQNKELDLNNHIHPYEHSLHKKIKFSIIPKKNFSSLNPDSFRIEISEKQHDKSAQAKEYAEFFGLKDMYNHHRDYASEILLKKEAYNDDWALGLRKLVPGISKEEALRYYYGNYINAEDINKRPLSKLTIDLLEED